MQYECKNAFLNRKCVPERVLVETSTGPSKICMGPSIKYVTLFLANFDPHPPVTLCHTSRDPPPESTSHISDPPIFSRSSTKKTDKSPLHKVSLNCSQGVFVRGFCQRAFGLEGFVPGGFCPFPLLSEYICYNRKLNITLNFMFHGYDEKMYKCDVTCSVPPPPVTNCHTFSDPLRPGA